MLRVNLLIFYSYHLCVQNRLLVADLYTLICIYIMIARQISHEILENAAVKQCWNDVINHYSNMKPDANLF